MPNNSAVPFSFAACAALHEGERMTVAPLGDSALVISWSEDLDDAVLARVSAFADAVTRSSVPGIVDVVPAFSSVTVHFDLHDVADASHLEAQLLGVAQRIEESVVRIPEPRKVEIPVCYGGPFGPDLEAIAQAARLSVEQAIVLHSEADYRVHAIGFLPGFGYLGGLPAKLHTPRRSTPRATVPAGTVAIGGAQTGIYPTATPGGWNLVGRTPLRMFDPARSETSLLRVGDQVVFRAISTEEFARWT